MATHWPSAVRYPLRGALASQHVADTTGHLPEVTEGERGGLDEAGQRLDEVDVDELAAAAVKVAVVQRHHDGCVADCAATPSARKNGGSVGGPSGSPVTWANPLMASASVP